MTGYAERPDATKGKATGPDPAPSGERVLPDGSGQRLRLEPAALTGQDVKGADARINQRNGAGWHVTDTINTLGGRPTKTRDELIGPSLGEELRNSVLIALAHDVIILVGVFAWLGKPVDGVFLAALLTVIGYSVNDSVVLFDRTRELLGRAGRRAPFARLANDAILQTLSLTDFALALLIGVGVGTYSLVFTASPLAIALWRKRGTGD